MEITNSDDLSAYQNKSYELSAVIDADSFFYVLSDYGDKYIHHGKASMAELSVDKLVPNERVSIRRTKLGIANDLFTIVPATDYHGSKKEAYVRHAAALDPSVTYIFASDYHAQARAYICYAMPQSVVQTCQQTFDQPVFAHIIAAVMDRACQATEKSSSIYLCKVASQTLMLFVDEGVFKLGRVIKADGPLNILYFTSLVTEIYQLDPALINIELSGAIDPGDRINALLQKYFANVNFSEIPIHLQMDNPSHIAAYLPIYSVSKCA